MLEFSANINPVPVSYEGEELPIHMIIYKGEFIIGDHMDLTNRVGYPPISGWRNHYDCNVVHAVNTLRGMGCEVEGFSVVGKHAD